MTGLEEELSRELKGVAELAKPESIRPLHIPPPRRRFAAARWLAPVTAAAAVAGLVAGVTTVLHTAGSSSDAAVKGAVATVANPPGESASCIFPMETTACYGLWNYQYFEYLMVRPLYMFGGNNDSVTVNYALSPANRPVYSDHGRTVVINIKRWKWSNGQTVDAKDLIFFLNMLEAEKANYAGYTPGLLPDNIASYNATGPQQVTLHLTRAYSAIWYLYDQLSMLYPFPLTWDVTRAGAAPGSGGCTTDSAADHWAKCTAVWTYLNSQNKDISSYATNPLWKVVDGPFKLKSYNDLSGYTFVPNAKYSGSPKPSIARLKFIDSGTETAYYNELKAGIPSEAPVPPALLPKAGKSPLASTPRGGYNLQAALSFAIGFSYINYNNPTYGPVFRQLYFRQALTMLDDQARMNALAGRGNSESTVAGVPTKPPSQWVSPAMKENGGQGPYPYNPSKAEALLAAHGWKVKGGVLTCESSACGTGVSVGTQAKFSMLYNSEGSTAQTDQVNVLKAGFAQAGIKLTLNAEPLDFLISNYTQPCTPSESRCGWTFVFMFSFNWPFIGPGFEPSGESLFQTGAANNSGSYSNATMNRLISQTHTSNSLAAFDAYADYTAEQVPSLWLPVPVGTEAVSKHMHHVSQSPVGTFVPEYWTCSSKAC